MAPLHETHLNARCFPLASRRGACFMQYSLGPWHPPVYWCRLPMCHTSHQCKQACLRQPVHTFNGWRAQRSAHWARRHVQPASTRRQSCRCRAWCLRRRLGKCRSPVAQASTIVLNVNTHHGDGLITKCARPGRELGGRASSFRDAAASHHGGSRARSSGRTESAPRSTMRTIARLASPS